MSDLNLPDHYPEILADLAGLVLARALEYLPGECAETLAVELAEDVRLKFGGALVYIPTGCAADRRDRNTAIWRDFNGRNHAHLARKYRLALQTIYDILARERAARQADLFN